jgi:hypothetical protein
VGWRFFLWWMLAFLGFPIGGQLAILVVGSIGGLATGALAGALAGAIIGTAQWLVLRRYTQVGPAWIGATALGMAVGDGLGALLTGVGTGIGALVTTGLVTGIAVGLLQWAVLREHLRAAGLWVPVSIVAWPVGWTVTWSIGVDVERGYAVFGSSGAITFAAITGVAMIFLIRGRTGQLDEI